jgi:hypothetical protein
MRTGPSGARPAEVLSSSVRRAPGRSRREPARARQPIPVVAQPISTDEFAYVHVAPPARAGHQQPQDTPSAAPQPQYAFSDSVVPYDGYLESSAGNPAYGPAYASAAASDSGYASIIEPSPIVAESPQLVEAKASLRPPSAPLRPPASLLPSSSLRPPPPSTPVFAAYIPNAAADDLVVPVVKVQQFAAPIPELEPVRYQHIVAWEPSPPKSVMMSDAPRHEENRPAEIKRALAPLPAPAPASRGWVPSPATAMRRVY